MSLKWLTLPFFASKGEKIPSQLFLRGVCLPLCLPVSVKETCYIDRHQIKLYSKHVIGDTFETHFLLLRGHDEQGSLLLQVKSKQEEQWISPPCHCQEQTRCCREALALKLFCLTGFLVLCSTTTVATAAADTTTDNV